MNSDSNVSGLLFWFVCLFVQSEQGVGEGRSGDAPEHVSCVIRRELSDAVWGRAVYDKQANQRVEKNGGGTHTQLL